MARHPFFSEEELSEAQAEIMLDQYRKAQADAMYLQWLAELARIYQAEGYEAAEEWLCKARG